MRECATLLIMGFSTGAIIEPHHSWNKQLSSKKGSHYYEYPVSHTMNFAEELKLGDMETKPLSSIGNRAPFGVIEEET